MERLEQRGREERGGREGPTGVPGLTNERRGSMMPLLTTKSLHSGPSPEMLARAHSACSHTWTSLE